MKKALSLLLLFGMLLHAGGRLGVISYLYTNRFDIAYSIGISEERPISMCKSDHFQQTQLNLSSERGKQIPSGLVPVLEINLFHAAPTLTIPIPLCSNQELTIGVIQCYYNTPHSDIFHPPGFLS